jgi:hypothetical protein
MSAQLKSRRVGLWDTEARHTVVSSKANRPQLSYFVRRCRYGII